eukprot:jgi/Chrzof1/6611/Cz19g02180.t1
MQRKSHCAWPREVKGGGCSTALNKHLFHQQVAATMRTQCRQLQLNSRLVQQRLPATEETKETCCINSGINLLHQPLFDGVQGY